jgi:hypothetical protein
MEKMHANSFRDLIVYQKAKSVSRLIFELSKTFPNEEKYKFCGSEPGSIREEVSNYIISPTADN